jgi:4-hydroxybenzoate polyprenyltransferase
MNAFLTRSRLMLDMIKFEHTIFALPFALISFMLAIRHTPTGFNGATLFWIVVAMVGARSAAMAFNRLVDAEYDAENPRTAKRHIPAGLLSRAQVTVFLLIAIVLFEIAAWRLNRLCLLLSPVALGAILGYSYTKRFTALCHLFLGFAIGIAPIGAWIAVRGTLDLVPILLGAVVMLWIGGFDIIYALQDYDFDRETALFSLPKAIGKSNALRVSRLMHTFAVALLVLTGRFEHLHVLYYAGVVVAAALILYEQTLVKPDDLSRVDLAFFTLNGWVSVSLFAFVLLDSVLLR